MAGFTARCVLRRFSRPFFLLHRNYMEVFEAPKPLHLECSKDETTARVVLPGYHQGDFNGSARINPWRVASYGEVARYTLLSIDSERNFAQMQALARQFMIFQLCARYHLSEELYKTAHVNQPITTQYELKSIGKTSYRLAEQSVSHQSVQITSGEMIQVVVDRNTHRPVPLPDWYTQRFSHLAQGTGSGWRYDIQSPPDITFASPYRVAWSDTDYYGHMNHGAYIRICLDCLAEAGFKKFFSGSEMNFPSLRIKEIQMYYKDQCKPLDELLVHAWRDRQTLNTFHTQVTRASATIFYLTVIYHDL